MFSQPVSSLMERRKFVVVAPQTTVFEAAKIMTSKRIGALLVVEHDHLRGIFTERDAVFRVIAKSKDPRATKLSDVMTPDPKTIAPNKSYGAAMTLMHENGFRHLPVVEHGKPIGIISSRNALDPDMEEFVAEERRRIHFEQSR